VGELRGDVEVHPQDTVGDRVSLSGSAGYDGVCHRAEGHGRGKSSGAHPTPSCTPSVELHDLATEDPHNRLIKLLLGAPLVLLLDVVADDGLPEFRANIGHELLIESKKSCNSSCLAGINVVHVLEEFLDFCSPGILQVNSVIRDPSVCQE